MKNNFTEKKLLLGIFIIALILRLIFVFSLDSKKLILMGHERNIKEFVHLADQPIYDILAFNISSGRGFSLPIPTEDETGYLSAMINSSVGRIGFFKEGKVFGGMVYFGQPTAFWDPAYPIFISGIYYLFGRDLLMPRVTQAILGAIACIFIFLIGKEAVNRKVGILSAMIAACYPLLIYYSGTLMTENIVYFFMLLIIFSYYKFRKSPTIFNIALVGVFIALLFLSRATIVLFIPCLFLLIFIDSTKNRLISVLLIMGIFCLFVSPWVIRNYNVFGSPVFLPTRGGFNFWFQNNATLNQDIFLNKAQFEQFKKVMGDKEVSSIKKREYLTFPSFNNETELERSKILSKMAIGFIINNPLIFIRLCKIRFIETFSIVPKKVKGLIYIIVSWFSVGLILPFSLLGIFISLKEWRKVLPLYFIIFYYISVITLTMGGTRARLPIEPFLIIFASIPISKLIDLTSKLLAINNSNKGRKIL